MERPCILEREPLLSLPAQYRRNTFKQTPFCRNRATRPPRPRQNISLLDGVLMANSGSSQHRRRFQERDRWHLLRSRAPRIPRAARAARSKQFQPIDSLCGHPSRDGRFRLGRGVLPLAATGRVDACLKGASHPGTIAGAGLERPCLNAVGRSVQTPARRARLPAISARPMAPMARTTCASWSDHWPPPIAVVSWA